MVHAGVDSRQGIFFCAVQLAMIRGDALELPGRAIPLTLLQAFDAGRQRDPVRLILPGDKTNARRSDYHETDMAILRWRRRALALAEDVSGSRGGRRVFRLV